MQAPGCGAGKWAWDSRVRGLLVRVGSELFFFKFYFYFKLGLCVWWVCVYEAQVPKEVRGHR